MCGYAAACGVVECVCNSAGNWGCAYPACSDGGVLFDAGVPGD
jgi:hypothetical protein